MSDDDEGRSPRDRRVAELEAEVVRLQHEVVRLRTARVEELDEIYDDSALGRSIAGLSATEVDAERVRMNDSLIPTVTRLMLMFMFRADGTPYNYVEWAVGGVPETGPLTLTLQRAQGKTPNELRLAAEAQLHTVRTWLLHHARHGLGCDGPGRCSCGLADLLGDAIGAVDAPPAVRACYWCGHAHDPAVVCRQREIFEGEHHT